MDNSENRAEVFAHFIIDNKQTIRATAKEFGYSKSTVHNDVSNKLKKQNYALYLLVQEVLGENFNVKHIRGGLATKLMYQRIHMSNSKENNLY